jgi:hypothetical protein
MDELKRYAGIFAVVAALVLGTWWMQSITPPPGSPAQLSQLQLHLEEIYLRGVDRNDFSLRYRAEPPKTILIVIKRLPSADKNLVARVADSAVSTVRGVGKEKFGLEDLDVRVEVSDIPAPPTQK